MESLMKKKLIECESCFANIGILQLKIPRTCVDCRGTFCTECTNHVENALFDRRCQQCVLLSTGRFTRNGLKEMRMKTILSFLKRRGINYSGCADKSDLVDVVCEVFKIPLDTNFPSESSRSFRSPYNFNAAGSTAAATASSIDEEPVASTSASDSNNFSSPSFPPPTYDEATATSTTANISRDNTSVPTADLHNNRNSRQSPSELLNDASHYEDNKFKDMVRISLAAIEDIDQIDLLSVNQLKQLLAANHMQVAAGCKEKEELRQQVRMLYIAEQRRLLQKTSDESMDWSNTCKICMSNEIDCVLLDCGHLCCCLDCGKSLAECPFCRALVVRTVRVFKS